MPIWPPPLQTMGGGPWASTPAATKTTAMNSVEVRLTAELIVMPRPAVGSVASAKRVAGDVGGAREVGGPCEAPGNGRKLAYNGRTSACNRRKLAPDPTNFLESASFH